MRKNLTLAVALLLSTITTFAQVATLTLRGTLHDSENRPVAYATVILTPDGSDYDPNNKEHKMAVANKEGTFELEATEGNYTLTISCVGFEQYSTELTLTKNTSLGTITLKESATAIDELTITGQLVTREADRYVMNNISESKLALGRDSYEMLKLAPGVWADESGSISINGKSGVKVLINEREMRMTGDQLMAYLKALPAGNLQKIEIIPQSGADYDADSASGIIKITLRKLRDSGTNGSVSIALHQATRTPSYSFGPYANINHKNGKWNVYGNLSLSQSAQNSGDLLMEEKTHYDNGASLRSTTSMDVIGNNGGGMAGVIYDIDEKSNIGVEYNIWHNPARPSYTASTLSYTLGDLTESHSGLYEKLSQTTSQSITANYIRHLDEKGSTLKIIADWAGNNTFGTNNNTNQVVHTIGGVAGTPIDSLYRNTSSAYYSYYTLTAAVEHKLSDLTTLSYGTKYSLTDTYSRTDYSYLKGDQWQQLDSYNTLTDYNEHIGALYGIFSTRFASGSSLSVGLRGELTYIPQLNQKYASLFPNISYSQPLNPMQTVIMAASYKRGIRRPSFWNMNPVRTQLSEYSYQVGNPDLRPVYSNEFSLSAILFYRYTITLGGYLQDDNITQISMVDEADPTGRTLKYLHTNINNLYQYYIQLSAPAQLTKWWTMNANLLGVMLDQRIVANDQNDRTFTAQGYMTNTFTLPQKWFIDLTGQFITDAKVGNLTQKGAGNISLAVKKQLLDGNLTIALGLNNILSTSDQRVSSSGAGFTRSYFQPNLWRRSVNLVVRYNFQSGKMFRAKSVESGAADEKSRM